MSATQGTPFQSTRPALGQ